MSKKLYIVLPLAVISLFSCKELYDYKAETSSDYLVVEGMITDDPGPYYVTLSKAVAYDNDMRIYNYKPEKESGATVSIKSDKGEEAILYEDNNKPGTYATRAEDIKGEIGHKYWLYIHTQNGEDYESYPSTLFGKPDIPNLHVVSAEKTVLDESVPGGKLVTKNGMQLSCDVDNINAADYIKIEFKIFSPKYYLIDSIFYANTIMFTHDSLTPDTLLLPAYVKYTDIYCWILRPPESIPNIIGTGHSPPGSLLKDIPVGFVDQGTSYSGRDSIFSDLPEGYVISDIGREIDGGQLITIIIQTLFSIYYFVDLQAYAINDTIYEYYRNLENQSTANNKIFDPIPVELIGNLHCITNPKKNIYGIFTVASVMKKQFYVRWAGSYSEPYIENLDFYFPVQSSDCAVDEPPVFWRHF
jgi:hypothetical protein